MDVFVLNGVNPDTGAISDYRLNDVFIYNFDVVWMDTPGGFYKDDEFVE